MLRLKTDIQIEWLKAGDFIPEAYATPGLKQRLADWCYAYARKSIDTARPILEALSQKYPLVLVSNFYGNIESVLKIFIWILILNRLSNQQLSVSANPIRLYSG